MKDKNGKDLIDILPDNLSEDTVAAISNLVESKVNDKTESVKKVLNSRFMGFMTENINRFKSLAVKELESENDTFKSAKLFSEIKRLVAEEVMDDEVKEILESKDQEIMELKKLVVELKNHIDVVEERSVALTESIVAYENADLEYFSEDDDEDLKGDAVVISENIDEDIEDDDETSTYEGNEFLNEDVIAASRMITENTKNLLGE